MTLSAAAFTLLCAYALGRTFAAMARLSLERPLTFLAGAALLSQAVLALGLLGLANRAAFLTLGLVVLAAGWLVKAPPAPAAPRPRWLWLALSPFALVYLVHAMAPEMSPDGLAYHLSLPLRYLREGRIGFVPTDLYAQLSQGMEMLFLFVLAGANRSAAALVHLAFLFALVALIWNFAQRVTARWGAFAACALVFCSPVVGIDAASAYTDVAMAAVVFGVYVLLERWRNEPKHGLVIAAGLLAGFGYAIKYTAFLAVPYGFVLVVWTTRAWRPALLFLAPALAMILPWMAKNWVFTGNPVAPFLNHWFPNVVFDRALEVAYVNSLRWYPGLGAASTLPWEVAGNGFYVNGFLGPVWLLAPLALFSLKTPAGRRLLLAGLLFALPYASNVGTRFLIPALPFVAIAWAMAFGKRQWALVTLAAAHAVLCWPWVASFYTHRYSWRIREFPWQAALRLESEERFLGRRLTETAAALALNQHVRPGEKVLAQTQFTDALTHAGMVTGPLSRPSVELLRMLYMTSVPRLRPTGRIRFWFMTRPYQALRLRQTGGAVGQIAEVRIYHLLTPLERTQSWTFDARPNPWQAASAFDQTTVTRWMGEEVTVRFGAAASVDRIDLVYHRLPPEPTFVVEGQGEDGVWRLVSERGEVAPAPEQSEDLPHSAARVLLNNGIRYLLLRDRDYHRDLGGLTPEKNMADWPVTRLFSQYGIHLYRIDQDRLRNSPPAL